MTIIRLEVEFGDDAVAGWFFGAMTGDDRDICLAIEKIIHARLFGRISEGLGHAAVDGYCTYPEHIQVNVMDEYEDLLQ